MAMALVTTLSILLNIYLCIIVWGLRDEMGAEKWWGTFVSPIFRKETPVVSCYFLENDEIFVDELKTAIANYSRLEVPDTNYFWGVSDKFFMLKLVFMGDTKKLAVFEKSVQNKLRNAVYRLYGISTPTVVYATKQAEDDYIVTFLFALDEAGVNALFDYIEREKLLRKNTKKKVVATDTALETELKKNGF